MEQDSTSSPTDSPPPLASETGPAELRSEEKNWAVLAHLASVAGWIGIPFGHILAPLAVWLFKKDESEFVRTQAIESLNFQISMTLYGFLAGLLAASIIGLVFAIPAIIAIVIGDIVYTILGAVKVSNGVPYRYPFTIRLLG